MGSCRPALSGLESRGQPPRVGPAVGPTLSGAGATLPAFDGSLSSLMAAWPS